MDRAVENGEPPRGRQLIFAKYEILRELGCGGMAQVFEARHLEIGNSVALKIVRPSVASHSQAAARFLREAKAAAQIVHPNVVRVFDIGMQQGTPCIVMEFLDGHDLATLLATRGPLRVPSIIDLFLPIISAVATAHDSGIIHRDLKPANLMITRRGPEGVHPVVLDFGISKIVGGETEGPLTQSDSLLGTLEYMAPELTRGAQFAGAYSDQYALGVILYECATGRRPFSGATQYELMHAVVTSTLVPPSELNPSVPPEFDAVVMRAMARDPAERFPSVRALGAALLPLADQVNWALWKRELLGGTAALDPWEPDLTTLSDGAPYQRRSPTPESTAPKARYRRWVLSTLAAYGAVMTYIVCVRSPEVVRPSVPVAAISPIAASPLVRRDDRDPSSFDRNDPKAAPAEDRAAPIDSPVQAVATKGVGSLDPRALHPARSSPPASIAPVPGRPTSVTVPSAAPAAQRQPLMRGTNGVPIID